MISIVVPCYNSGHTIAITIKSLLAQTRRDFQVVIVDDGSTDNTSTICDQLSEEDSRIKVIHQSNKGLMGAWKRGVVEADGDYIAFSDADDYLDESFIERIETIISEFSPDLIIYGMVIHYSNGDSVNYCNKVPEGYYDRGAIKDTILPQLLSNGSMQSELIAKSRCMKVFRRYSLMSVMPDLNDRISLGEDGLTMFATVQIIRSMFCMGKYYPYHYVRRNTSMIGQFDTRVFDKIDSLYYEMNRIAKTYSYDYPEQLLYDRLSVTLLFVKKYICKSLDGYYKTKKQIDRVRQSLDFNSAIGGCSIKKYSFGSKVFARMFIMKMYFPLYWFTRFYEKIRGRDV